MMRDGCNHDAVVGALQWLWGVDGICERLNAQHWWAHGLMIAWQEPIADSGRFGWPLLGVGLELRWWHEIDAFMMPLLEHFEGCEACMAWASDAVLSMGRHEV